MSRHPLLAATQRLARRSWFLSCLLLGAGGCVRVSQVRYPDSSHPSRVARPVTHANQANTRMQSTASTAPTVAPVSYNEPIQGSPPVAANVESPLPYGAAMNGAAMNGAAMNGAAINGAAMNGATMYGAAMCVPPMAGDACGSLAPIEPGPVPPYWNDQEYLYDGGDREPRVQVTESWEVHGLDSQDTVAHYETIDGKLCVAASNRVPIYAPRFGAVRKVAAPILAARAVGAERMLEPTGAVVQQSRDTAGDVTAPVGPKKQTSVKLIDGLRDRTRGVPTERITPLVNVSNPQVAFQHLEGLGTAVRREDLEARLSETMINARTWTNDESIAVMVGGVQAVEIRDAKQVQDVMVFETEPGKCTLRICKAASHSAASPGDIISFSIRFDNVGDKPIGNLVILDSLTTRLEYIDGSQQCILSVASANKTGDKAAAGAVKFSTAENEAGSTVLKWEADLPLASGDSGVISFRCRVR